MPKITLYGPTLSTYFRTVRLLLEEAGAEYEIKNIDMFKGETQSPDYLKKHPLGKVPALEVDGEVIYETSAITDYLDTVVANHQFTPSDPLAKARMRQIVAIIDHYLYSPAIRTIVIQRAIVPQQGGKTDEEAVKNAVAPTQKALEAIEALTVGTPYLLGSSLSIADFYLIPILIYLSQMPEFAAVTTETPKINAWWEQAKKLPTVQKVCA